jgi:hypothetical protein
MQQEFPVFPEVTALRTVMLDVDKLDAFTDLYVRTVEKIGTDMHQVKNTDKLLEGLYRQKLTAVHALLDEQIGWLKGQCEGEA